MSSDLIEELAGQLARERRAREELEARFLGTFENAAVSIAHVDRDGRWLRVNDALCRITGYTRQELLTKTFGDITHPDDLDADWSQARRVLAGEIATYSIIASLIHMQQRPLIDSTAKDALEECRTRVQAIALSHEMLYQSKDFARIPIAQYVRALVGNLQRVACAPETAVSIELALCDAVIAVNRAMPCGLVLNELITNALKHAFAGRAGTIRVEIVQLVATLCEQLEARLDVARIGGTTFQLTFRA